MLNIVYILLTIASASFHGHAEGLDRDRISDLKYIATLQNRLPGIFQESVADNFDLFAFLKKRKHLRESLTELELRHLEERDLIQFTFTDEVRVGGSERQLRPEFNALWLMEFASDREITHPPGELSVREQLIRLIAKQSREQRAELLREPTPRLIDALVKEGLLDAPAGAEMRRQFRDSQLRLYQLLRKSRVEAAPDLNPETLLEPFEDLAERKRLIDNLWPTNLSGRPALVRTINAEIEELITAAHVTVNVPKTLVKHGVRVTELPPDVALLKGAIGKDCSSAYCLAYPYSEFERVFEITDAKGRMGYFSISEVDSANTHAWYLNTVNGRRLSPEVLQTVIFGLMNALPSLGVHRLIIPTAEKVEENVNFAGLVERLELLAKGSTPVTIRFLDEEKRAELEKFSEADYDSTQKNIQGRALRNHPNSVRWTIANAEYPPVQLGDVKQQSWNLIIDLLIAGKIQIVENLVSWLALPDNELAELQRVIYNQQHWPIQQWEERVQSWFVANHLERWTKPFLTSATADRARVLARDSTSPEHWDLTQGRALRWIDGLSRISHDRLVQDWLKSLSPKFKDSFAKRVANDFDSTVGIFGTPSTGNIIHKPPFFDLRRIWTLGELLGGEINNDFAQLYRLGFSPVRWLSIFEAADTTLQIVNVLETIRPDEISSFVEEYLTAVRARGDSRELVSDDNLRLHLFWSLLTKSLASPEAARALENPEFEPFRKYVTFSAKMESAPTVEQLIQVIRDQIATEEEESVRENLIARGARVLVKGIEADRRSAHDAALFYQAFKQVGSIQYLLWSESADEKKLLAYLEVLAEASSDDPTVLLHAFSESKEIQKQIALNTRLDTLLSASARSRLLPDLTRQIVIFESADFASAKTKLDAIRMQAQHSGGHFVMYDGVVDRLLNFEDADIETLLDWVRDRNISVGQNTQNFANWAPLIKTLSQLKNLMTLATRESSFGGFQLISGFLTGHPDPGSVLSAEDLLQLLEDHELTGYLPHLPAIQSTNCARMLAPDF